MTPFDKMVKEYNGVLYSHMANTAILERLKQYEDTDIDPLLFSAYKQAYDLLRSMPTCNTCNHQPCEYVKWGDPVVYRCPHYAADEWLVANHQCAKNEKG